MFEISRRLRTQKDFTTVLAQFPALTDTLLGNEVTSLKPLSWLGWYSVNNSLAAIRDIYYMSTNRER